MWHDTATVVPSLQVQMKDYLGCSNFNGVAQERAGSKSSESMAQVCMIHM